MIGEVGILSVGAGDTKISFDPANPEERARAARIVKEMMRAGYAVMVDSGQKDAKGRPLYTRATDFDEETCEYVIFDTAETVGATDEKTIETSAHRAGKTTKRLKHKRVKAEATAATSISRSAGG